MSAFGPPSSAVTLVMFLEQQAVVSTLGAHLHPVELLEQPLHFPHLELPLLLLARPPLERQQHQHPPSALASPVLLGALAALGHLARPPVQVTEAICCDACEQPISQALSVPVFEPHAWCHKLLDCHPGTVFGGNTPAATPSMFGAASTPAPAASASFPQVDAAPDSARFGLVDDA